MFPCTRASQLTCPTCSPCSYVGYFCFMAGVSLSSGVEVTTPRTLWRLADTTALAKLLPAVGMVTLLTVVLRRSRSPYALPALLLAVPAAFYAVLALGGWSLEDARRAGWVVTPQASAERCKGPSIVIFFFFFFLFLSALWCL